MVETKSSTDFAMGRRPKLKSEEFFVSTILVIEIIAEFVFETAKKCYTDQEHDPRRTAGIGSRQAEGPPHARQPSRSLGGLRVRRDDAVWCARLSCTFRGAATPWSVRACVSRAACVRLRVERDRELSQLSSRTRPVLTRRDLAGRLRSLRSARTTSTDTHNSDGISLLSHGTHSLPSHQIQCARALCPPAAAKSKNMAATTSFHTCSSPPRFHAP
jgi:hypothetical protein